MFAIVEFKSRQIRAEENKEYKIPFFACKVGDKLEAEKILLISNEKQILTGDKDLEKSKVEAEVVEIGQDKKVSVVKFHSKKHYQKLGGHRQDFVKVKINKITA